MNGLSNLHETHMKYSLAPTDETVRLWKSKVKVTKQAFLLLLSFSVFVFSFPYVFVSVPALDWISRQLLSARVNLPYRIVSKGQRSNPNPKRPAWVSMSIRLQSLHTSLVV